MQSKYQNTLKIQFCPRVSNTISVIPFSFRAPVQLCILWISTELISVPRGTEIKILVQWDQCSTASPSGQILSNVKYSLIYLFIAPLWQNSRLWGLKPSVEVYFFTGCSVVLLLKAATLIFQLTWGKMCTMKKEVLVWTIQFLCRPSVCGLSLCGFL